MAARLHAATALSHDSTVAAVSSGAGASSADLSEHAILRGDKDTFDELLATCRNYLLLVADAELDPNLRAKVGASDLVQETLLDAKRGREQFAGTTRSQLLAWLRGILVNKLCDAGRHYQGTQKRCLSREVSLERDLGSQVRDNLADPIAETPSRLVADGERDATFARALASLSDEHRLVIVLRNWEQRSFAEIGVRMNRSAEAARKLWSRALEKLKDQWVSEHGTR
jgi:RNA polymerase sigma-70 factor (ECF subfamily)